MTCVADIDGIVREFRTHAGVCARPEGAYANCLAASVQFVERCRAAGIASGIEHFKGVRSRPAEASGRWPWVPRSDFAHWVARVGEFGIDWTARQFDPPADWPRIVPIETLAAEYSDTETWACPSCERLVDDERHAELRTDLERPHREISQATGGRGPFPDPRHDHTAPLRRICGCGGGWGTRA